MQHLFIDREHAFEFARVNRVKLPEHAYLNTRCIDGRYESTPETPFFTFPGADAGEFLLACSAANEFGFDIDYDKVFAVLTKLVGGKENLRFHTDEHAHSDEPLKGCGYVGQVRQAPADYGIIPADISYVEKAFAQAQKAGAKQTVLRGDHEESVVFLVRGGYGIMPQGDAIVDNRRHHIQAFIYHQTLADKRHRLYAKALLEEGALVIPAGVDESYLYEVFADVAETQLMETLRRLAKGLPIYEIVFDKDGLFEIEDMGTV